MKNGTIPDENVTTKEAKVTASVLDAFDLLKASKDDAKLSGGAKIISQLQIHESEKDVKYVLKRLIRSLGANVPEMRTGYFSTLVMFLSKFDKTTVPEIFDLIKKELHANGSSKSEVGDVSLGQIMVCGAVFRSGMMLRCGEEEQKKVIELLLNASAKKSYLSNIAYMILLDFATSLNEDQFNSIIWLNIKQKFKKDIKEHSLDTLYFLMKVASQFPDKVKLRKLIGIPDLLCEDNIHFLCEKLMAGIDFSSVNHPIYQEVGRQIAVSPHLKLFWTSGIDSQLTKHNRNRELVAINLLTTILNNLTDGTEVIPDLISNNFFKLFIDWFKGLQTASKMRNKRDNEDDHKIMIKKEKELLNALAKALKKDNVSSKTKVDTLKKLLFDPGEMNFTDITGTSIVKSIIADLDKDGVKKMAKLFKGVLLNTNKKEVKDGVERNWFNNERIKAAEMISYLVTHDSIKDDIEFKLTYMKFLMCFGFFKIGGDDNVSVSRDMSGAIKTCFYRCFTSRFSNVDNLLEVLSSLSSFINITLEKEQVRTKLEKQFSQQNMECWELVTKVSKNIEENESKSKVEKVFLILLYQLGLFLFSEPTHVKMATSSIKELNSCYAHYIKGKKKKPKKIKEGDLTEEEPEWIEVLVEVLLSILSIESSVLRSVVQCVFRLLWEYLTPSAIGQIVSVLDPEHESNPLGEENDSDAESNDKSDSEKESENEDDDEMKTEQDEESDDESQDEGEEDDDDDMKIPDQLRMAVQTALGNVAADSDAESINADLIDEEEGKKLDEALAEAFRQFQQGKGKKTKKDRKEKKEISDFRIRVLDLIDIYLEKDPSMDISLGMIAPLTSCLEFCIQDSQFSELENRVRKTIKNLTKIRKFSSNENVDIEVLCEYLKTTIDKGSRSHFLFQALGDVITHFAQFIIHCSLKVEVKKLKSPKKDKSKSPLTEILKEALQNYFQNRNCLLPIIFFHNILQTEWEGNYDLLQILIDNIFDNNVRQFRRNEGLELLAGFYRALKRNKPTSDKLLSKLSNIESKFETTLTNTFKGETGFEAKNNFFTVLKKLINTIKLFHESCHIESSLDFKSLLDTIGSCKVNIKTKVKGSAPEIKNQGTNGKKAKKNKKKRKPEKMNGHTEPVQKKVRKDSDSTK